MMAVAPGNGPAGGAARGREMREQAVPGQAAAGDDGGMEAEVERAAALAAETGGLGPPGRPLNKRSPFFIGMAAAAGVAVTVGLVELIIAARSVLILVGLALFIAAGLDPLAGWLTRHRVPRWGAVLVIAGAGIGLIGGFLALAIPPLVGQATTLAHELPSYLHSLQNHNSGLGRLNERFHIQQRLISLLSGSGAKSLVGGVLGAGQVVISAASSVVVVGVLVIYFLAAMPRIKLFLYRLAPRSRRTRVILLGDEVVTKVGGFLLGNILTSLIAGIGTFLWMIALGIPYPLLFGLFVALADLVPVIGSTIGGAVVTLVALTVSLPVALATLGFYVAYRLAEDYLLVPRVMGHTVQVSAVVSIVAVLVGGALMGIIGALVAIPVAAVLRLLIDEIVFPRLDRG
jgi:predicted PurR-regulated permease PerM